VQKGGTGGGGSEGAERVVKEGTPEAPGTGETVAALGEAFREMLRARC